MAGASEQDTSIEELQKFCAVVVGLFVGLLPLARVLFGGGPGRPMVWVNRQLGDPPAYLIPLCVLVIAAAVIAIVETTKPQT